jgi:hypothetical protein
MLKLCFLLVSVMAATTGGVKRMTGGYSTCPDTDDSTVQQAAQFAVATIQESSNSMYTSTLVRVVECQQQVVSGMNYKMTLQVGVTGCRVGAANPPSNCGTVTQTQECQVTVWSQSWVTPPMQLTAQKCGAFVAATKGGANDV